MLNFLGGCFYIPHCTGEVFVVRLLKEAEPHEEKRNVEMGDERCRTVYSEDENVGDGLESEERKLLSRYGVWLLVELTPAREDVSIVSLLYYLQIIVIQQHNTEAF